MTPTTDTPTTAPYVLRSDAGGVASLTLNRGELYNPLSMAMMQALSAQLDAIAHDTSIRTVVLGAHGKGFCAGHDLREVQAQQDAAWQQALFDCCNQMMMRLQRLPQPVIARVHGIATAAGCQLVSMCDLAVASSDARFALPGVSIGLFCSTPAVGVARNVSRKRAMELLLTGESIDAATALDWGLVNRVVRPEQIDAEIAKFTSAIAARSAAVIALGKPAFYEQVDLGLTAAYTSAAQAMTRNLQHPAAHEGIDAFLVKRKPLWPS